MANHYHLMNGESGCIPDSNEVFTRQRDALEWAETLFGDGLCDPCFNKMRKELRSRHSRQHGTTHYFDRDCERESPIGGLCCAGASIVEFVVCDDKDCMEGEE